MPYRTSEEPAQFPPGFVEALKAAFVVDASKPDRVAIEVKGRFGESSLRNPFFMLLFFLVWAVISCWVLDEVSVAQSRCITVVTTCCAVACFAFERWGFGTKWLVMYAGTPALTIRSGVLAFARPPSAPYVSASWSSTGVLIDDCRYVLRRRVLRFPGAVARAAKALQARIYSSVGSGLAQAPADASATAGLTVAQGRALALTFDCFSRIGSETLIHGEKRSHYVLNVALVMPMMPLAIVVAVEGPVRYMAMWGAVPLWLLLFGVLFAFGLRQFSRRQRRILVFRDDSNELRIRENGQETACRNWCWRTQRDDDESNLLIEIGSRTYPLAHAVESKLVEVAMSTVRAWRPEAEDMS